MERGSSHLQSPVSKLRHFRKDKTFGLEIRVRQFLSQGEGDSKGTLGWSLSLYKATPPLAHPGTPFKPFTAVPGAAQHSVLTGSPPWPTSPKASGSQAEQSRSFVRGGLCSTSQETYHSFRRSGLFRIVEAIRAPLMGGLEYMGRIRILIWDSTLLASSKSLQTTVKAPTRSPRDKSQVLLQQHHPVPLCSPSGLLPWPC